MEYLQGGRDNKIIRVDDSVYRPAGFWSPSVHALLTHVHAQGFLGAPLPLGFDDKGNEILSFLPGEVSNYPLSPSAASLEALTSAARLLCDYHNATVSFLDDDISSFHWFLPPRQPVEVICHGDFAPYNIVLDGNRAVAIIDFDAAHPASRLWDIAYALYRWAPFTHPDSTEGFGTLEEQIQRAILFCTHYGLSAAQRRPLPGLIVTRLEALVDFMLTEAQAGNEDFQANLKDGHHLTYLADIEYVRLNQGYIETGLNG